MKLGRLTSFFFSHLGKKIGSICPLFFLLIATLKLLKLEKMQIKVGEHSVLCKHTKCEDE